MPHLYLYGEKKSGSHRREHFAHCFSPSSSSSSSSIMSLSSFAPLARATLATSSRVGLDFVLPAVRARAPVTASSRFISSSSPRPSPVPTTPLSAAASSSGRPKGWVQTRWDPINQQEFNRVNGTYDRAPTHTLTVMSSRNNVLLTFTDKTGPLCATITAGTDKVFKKHNRNNAEAANQAALKMFAKILAQARTWEERGHRMYLQVAFSGFGGVGRETVASAIGAADGEQLRPYITHIEDRTPIKIGGTRAPKPRRV